MEERQRAAAVHGAQGSGGGGYGVRCHGTALEPPREGAAAQSLGTAEKGAHGGAWVGEGGENGSWRGDGDSKAAGGCRSPQNRQWGRVPHARAIPPGEVGQRQNQGPKPLPPRRTSLHPWLPLNRPPLGGFGRHADTHHAQLLQGRLRLDSKDSLADLFGSRVWRHYHGQEWTRRTTTCSGDLDRTATMTRSRRS